MRPPSLGVAFGWSFEVGAHPSSLAAAIWTGPACGISRALEDLAAVETGELRKSRFHGTKPKIANGGFPPVADISHCLTGYLHHRA